MVVLAVAEVLAVADVKIDFDLKEKANYNVPCLTNESHVEQTDHMSNM